jgi:hypothetical protein
MHQIFDDIYEYMLPFIPDSHQIFDDSDVADADV